MALKIVVMTREQGTLNWEQGTLNWEQGTGNRFWATLLFVTYVGFFPFTYLFANLPVTNLLYKWVKNIYYLVQTTNY